MYAEREFDKAVQEIRFFLMGKARECEGRGWSFYTTENAPESYSELVKRSSSMSIPIANYGSDKSIYGDSITNTLFRFYHDVIHLEEELTFSLEDECKAADIHLKDAVEFNLSPLALQILEADTKGQVRYYFKWGKFVDNQKAFVQSCISKGIRNALRVEH